MPPKRDIMTELLERFPPSSTQDDRYKILILILDHTMIWADHSHGDFIEAFKDRYQVEASAPASSESYIHSKCPDIIFVTGAITIHKSCNREAIATRLKEFARNGGTVIFGGVPYGFNPANKPKDSGVFKKMFGLPWIVGTTQDTFCKRIPDASKPLIYDQRIKLQGTYLSNVDEEAALFYTCDNEVGAQPRKTAQCPVAYQAYGKGFMAYVGLEDLADCVTLKIYQALCAGV